MMVPHSVKLLLQCSMAYMALEAASVKGLCCGAAEISKGWKNPVKSRYKDSRVYVGAPGSLTKRKQTGR
jgi:hypothetical protein